MKRTETKKGSSPGFREYISLIKQGGAFAMHHSCGNVDPIIPDMIDCGLDILQSIQPEAYAEGVEALKRKHGRFLSISDVGLVIVSPETKVMKEAVTSRIAHVALLDSLYTAVALANYEESIRRIESMSRIPDETRF